MTVVYLTRVDPSCNMRRFYRLDIQPNLFGEWTVVKEWGRIGSGGQVRHATFASPVDAHAALDKQRAQKQRRGYQTQGKSAMYGSHH